METKKELSKKSRLNSLKQLALDNKHKRLDSINSV